jgi:hypothetical protein
MGFLVMGVVMYLFWARGKGLWLFADADFDATFEDEMDQLIVFNDDYKQELAALTRKVIFFYFFLALIKKNHDFQNVFCCLISTSKVVMPSKQINSSSQKRKFCSFFEFYIFFFMELSDRQFSFVKQICLGHIYVQFLETGQLHLNKRESSFFSLTM